MNDTRPKKPRRVVLAIVVIGFGIFIGFVRDPIAWAASVLLIIAGLWELLGPHRSNTRRQPSISIPPRYANVLDILDRFISDELGPYEWDDFTSVPIREDPWLDGIRTTCRELRLDPADWPKDGRDHKAALIRQVKMLHLEVEAHLRNVVAPATAARESR